MLPAAAAMAIVGLAVLSPAPAFASDEGRSWVDADNTFHKVIYDRAIAGTEPGGFPREEVRGTCPPGWPHLDTFAGTPGRSVGQGFYVSEESWGVAMTELGRQRLGEHISDTEMRVTSAVLDIWNHRFTRQHVTIIMVCTANPDKAWVTPIPW